MRKLGLHPVLERADGALDVTLDNGDSFIVDDVILATGYKVDLSSFHFLNERQSA
jgi:hypothetical protein